jgi:hypothetical protein
VFVAGGGAVGGHEAAAGKAPGNKKAAKKVNKTF